MYILRTNFNIPSLGHDTISHPSKAPTCTEGGWFAHVTCGRCDALATNQSNKSL